MTVSDLCLECGLCCEGSLFLYVALGAGEVERLERCGLPVLRKRDGSWVMRLGCRGLSGTRCTVYAERPVNCAGYFCALALALRAGRIGGEQALSTVRQARALVDEVAANLPARREDEPDSAVQRAHEVGLLCGPEPLRRLEEFLSEHFRAPSPPAAVKAR
jgi:hypothetical protein